MTSAQGRSWATSFTVAAVVFAAFLALAVAVLFGTTHGLDTWLLLALRNPADPSHPMGPAWLQATGRDVTALGSNGVLIALTFAAAGLLALAARRAAALFLLMSFWGALMLDLVTKYVVDRPRPELVPHAARVFTTSFPSAHATVSAASCLAAAALLARARPEQRFKAFAVAIAACLVVTIGVSRVYLGVHWPTDVAAGWALGTSWASLCLAIFSRRLRQHRHPVNLPADIPTRERPVQLDEGIESGRERM